MVDKELIPKHKIGEATAMKGTTLSRTSRLVNKPKVNIPNSGP